jgi:hypothetical protein
MKAMLAITKSILNEKGNKGSQMGHTKKKILKSNCNT